VRQITHFKSQKPKDAVAAPRAPNRAPYVGLDKKWAMRNDTLHGLQFFGEQSAGNTESPR
jgi:hypothetical protein